MSSRRSGSGFCLCPAAGQGRDGVADIFSKKRRSEIMSGIKGSDTEPEIVVRRLLHSMGYRFRLHGKALPGKPDIVLSRHRKAIFVHGCFWHGHPGCKRAKLPGSNRDFWQAKIQGNSERDKRNQDKLDALGWKVFVLWSCEVRKLDILRKHLKGFMDGA